MSAAQAAAKRGEAVDDLQLLTVKEAAGLLRLGESSVRRLVQRGHLRAHRLPPSSGDRVNLRIRRGDLVEFLDRHADGGGR